MEAQCGSCNRYLKEGEPAAFWFYSKYGTHGAIQLLCLGCWEHNPYVFKNEGEGHIWQCHGCDRYLLWQHRWLNTSRYRLCSVACAQRHRRGSGNNNLCKGCGKSLEGKRKSATTCSTACRVKVHREQARL